MSWIGVGGGSVGRRDGVFPILFSAALIVAATTKQPLLLFVCSAKLWLTLRNQHRIRSCRESGSIDDVDDDDDGNNNWTRFETHQQQQQQQQRPPPSLSSMDSYTDNILRGKERCHRRSSNNSSSSMLFSPHSNAQRCLPAKLILIRHGQSEGNLDESLYATKPDNAMGLTKLGWEMARMAGKALRGDDKEKKEGLLPPDESVHFIISPYVRTVETFHGIASAWVDPEEMMDFEEGEEEEDEEEMMMMTNSNGCNHDLNNNNNNNNNTNKNKNNNNNNNTNVDDNTNSISKRSKSRNSNIIKDYNGSYHNTNNCSIFSNNDHNNHRNIKHNNNNNNNNNLRCKRLKAWYKQLMKMGLTWHEDPRIREQDFGNFQDPVKIKTCKSERHKFGSFYYRYPHGESVSDVYDRVSTFLDSLWRSFESGRAQNYVVVAHGVSIRVFLARYFRYSIDQFSMMANPKNCEIIVLGHDGLGRLKLDGRIELELSKRPDEGDENGNVVAHESEEEKQRRAEKIVSPTERQTVTSSDATTVGTPVTTTVVTGYKRHSRLRTIPPQWVYPRTVRMCYNDTKHF